MLEAAHLYRYADSGRHHDDGGFLLRRDVHRLFDLGHIAVDPRTMRIDIGDDLLPFDDYARLQERKQSGVSGDVGYFHRLVAKAILWRRTEKIVSAQRFGGYRANIVAYSVAMLSHATGQRIDLERIWKQQGLDQPLELALEDLSHVVHKHLTDDDRPVANVTEWAKREKCWTSLRGAGWKLPPEVEDLLLPVGASLEGVPGDAFLAISSWAKETDNLTPWDRRFAYTIGVRLNRDKPLTEKQVPHAERILAAARELGFEPPG